MAETTDGLDLVVELLNTLDRRTFGRHGGDRGASDALTSPSALEAWLRARGPGTPGAGPHEPCTPHDLETARSLRAALRAALEDPDASGPLLAGFPLRLVPDATGRLVLAADTGVPGLDAIVTAAAASAASGRWHRVRLCASPDCRWAFHDTSRSGGGRWCSMEACGNRYKTRAYRRRRTG